MSWQGLPVWAVVPAAGGGSRMGAPIPKQYLVVAGRPILAHTLAALLACPAVDGIVVALSPDDRHFAALPEARLPTVVRVTGGQARADSVLAGLDWLALHRPGAAWALVHDAARPGLAPLLVERLLASVAADPPATAAGLLALPVADTVKRASAEGRVAETLDRTTLWRAQTPQMAEAGVLRRALLAARAAGAEVTDEASALERLGLAPRLVPGAEANFKVTWPEDLERLAALLDRAAPAGHGTLTACPVPVQAPTAPEPFPR